MFHFFSGAVKAGFRTAQALIMGPSQTQQEMYVAQKNRYQAFSNLAANLHYKTEQNLARKQYWCSQTYFLGKLIQNNPKEMQKIIQAPVSVATAKDLLETINSLIAALNDSLNVTNFLNLLELDIKNIQTTCLNSHASDAVFRPGIQLFEGDVIQLIKQLHDQNIMVITDNAPNSHRDGAAKYSRGSVEELMSRYTDSALKMALHFCNIHQRNIECEHYAFSDDPNPINVEAYQKRYLKMVLTICAKLVEKKEEYLESAEFFNDLFKSYPNPHSGLPIYFDMQNNVYELPLDESFISSHWFNDTTQLTNIEKMMKYLQKSAKDVPITVVSYAAPDLRKVETSPLDARSTSNTLLQHPEKLGAMGGSLSIGIAAQCQAAIKQAKFFKDQGIHQPLAVIFVMPGCGAFNNPVKQSAAQFISAIKHNYPELEALEIQCYVAEYNKKNFTALKEAHDFFNGELGQLNEAIINITHPEIRTKAIKVKEKILALYAQGDHSETLLQHINHTTQLLTMPPSPKRHALALEYQKNAHILFKNNNSLLQTLGAAMMVLGLAVMAAGFSFALTPVGLMVSGATVLGGVGLLVAGKGIFSHKKEENITALTEDLSLSCI